MLLIDNLRQSMQASLCLYGPPVVEQILREEIQKYRTTHIPPVIDEPHDYFDPDGDY
jgi:hypothetical protein